MNICNFFIYICINIKQPKLAASKDLKSLLLLLSSSLFYSIPKGHRPKWTMHLISIDRFMLLRCVLYVK